MSDDTPATIPDDVMAKVYRWALAHARREGRGDDELEQRLIDAATDAVMAARGKYDPGRGASFTTYAGTVVRLRVRQAVGRYAGKRGKRPAVGHFPDDYDPAAPDPVMPTDRPVTEAFDALPDDLRGAARLYLIDGYTLEDAGLLLGITAEAVRLRLRRAAAALSA